LRNADFNFLNQKCETWKLELPLFIDPEQSVSVTRSARLRANPFDHAVGMTQSVRAFWELKDQLRDVESFDGTHDEV
jgi:hypothetical protein